MNGDGLERWTFGGDGVDVDGLVALVLTGKKRATTSCLAAYEAEGDPLPQAGERSVLTDQAGTPRCVIRLLRVTVLPFEEVPWELARREGEDRTLETWQATHREIFTREGLELGYTFTPQTPVVIEEFEVEKILTKKRWGEG